MAQQDREFALNQAIINRIQTVVANIGNQLENPPDDDGDSKIDSEEFKKRIQGITIIRNGELLFTLTDGSQQSAEYSTKRRVKPLSEERKKNMSLKMKELWAKRKMQENN